MHEQREVEEMRQDACVKSDSTSLSLPGLLARITQPKEHWSCASRSIPAPRRQGHRYRRAESLEMRRSSTRSRVSKPDPCAHVLPSSKRGCRDRVYTANCGPCSWVGRSEGFDLRVHASQPFPGCSPHLTLDLGWSRTVRCEEQPGLARGRPGRLK